MHIHRGYENLKLVRPVVTLGIFDGVHLGHKVLLDRLVSAAKEVNGEAVVITFSPHPRLVLDKNSSSLAFLTTMEEKIVLLRRAKVDHLVIIEFTREFSSISACDFVMDILVKKIGTRHLIIGYNHHFGRKGEGNFNTVKQCTDSLDFRVEQVHGLQSDGGAISSSLAREALLQGRLDEANKLLGYSYSVSGTVIAGRKIGRSIGFPTANIKPDDQHKLIPCKGVYAVEVILGGKFYKGMLSIGSNPTVNDDPVLRSIEVHILDFQSDIYGSGITVIFRKRLRDEIRFDSMENLVLQMEIDKQSTIEIFS
ncbi:MAG: bifunctional riboflavin kinase/FAD synthetase [Bacteroidales bacterium]|nr:bifunctional riboflavin kinase/FAD synthetase [Bacteroidales bacterium]